LDRRLSGAASSNDDVFDLSSLVEIQSYKFQVLTVCHAGIIFTLQQILEQTKAFRSGNGIGINQILTHEETGHLKSFSRDKTVRRWCRRRSIPITEYNQTGVTRCLKNRDNFSTNFSVFLNQPLFETPTEVELGRIRSRVELATNRLKLTLCQQCASPINVMLELTEIPSEHRTDRPERQCGGETKAIATTNSFLRSRGKLYAQSISSPNTSWNSGGRLSPFLTWGHVSTRYVIYKLKRRQEELRLLKKKQTRKRIDNAGFGNLNHDNSDDNDGPWLRSLAAFSSRIHWRSHFIQKLESEPDMEIRDLCPAYQHLRRQPTDWNETYYHAWSTGTTGFPFVDASMRCLLRHGWINFRMRAMLVSFATYNLWLDWKRIAPHLARAFLDYEPGIHYPQLQMQAGTTGINAMRVYNVTKQGKDQDPRGVFIKKYVKELANVPLEYLHEPNKMSQKLQQKFRVCVGAAGAGANSTDGGQCRLVQLDILSNETKGEKYSYYPKPVVDENYSAKIAKEKVSAVKRQGLTKRLADRVYIKHGSRKTSTTNDDLKPKALSSKVKRLNIDNKQSTLKAMFKPKESQVPVGKRQKIELIVRDEADNVTEDEVVILNDSEDEVTIRKKTAVSSTALLAERCKGDAALFGNSKTFFENKPSLTQLEAKTTLVSGYISSKMPTSNIQMGAGSWSCITCTFLNDKPLALACLICGTIRG